MLRPALARLHRERPVDAILSTCEAAIVPVAREAEHFGTPYPGYDALCNAVFKHRMRGILRRAGLRSPDFEVLSEEALVGGGPHRIRIPFVVKPTRGFGKRFSAVCHTQAQFDAYAANVRRSRAASAPAFEQFVSHEYIVEEHVAGTLHSAEVIVCDGKVHCFATTMRYRSYYDELLEMTACMPSGLPAEKTAEIKSYVQQVFDALKLDIGLYHVELLMDADGPCLVEINARMMGSIGPQMYRMLADTDPFELLIRVHLGETIEIDDTRIRGAGMVTGVVARHGGEISASFDRATFDRLLKEYGITVSTLDIFPGMKVARFEGNLSAIGQVIITGDDPVSVMRKGHRFLMDLEPMLGLELAKYIDPKRE
jgi:biotin carboxylase